MANYNNILNIDNQNPQMQELKYAIKSNVLFPRMVNIMESNCWEY